MRLFLTSLALTISFFAFTQSNIDMEVYTDTGWEYNIFRASPQQEQKADQNEQPAIINGIYHSASISSAYKLKLDKHRFTIDGSLEYRYFPGHDRANQNLPKVKLLYYYRHSSTSKIYASVQYKKYAMLRINETGDEFQTQLGLEKKHAYLKHYLKVSRRLKLRTKASLSQVQFRTLSNNPLRYNAYSIYAGISQSLYSRKKIVHSANFSIEFSKRHYLPRVEDNFNRIRNDIEINFDFDLNWRYNALNFGVELRDRNDLIQDRFGYRQIKPFVRYQYDRKRLELTCKLSYNHRNFKTLLADNDSDELLQQRYLKYHLTAEYKLKKYMYLMTGIYYIGRTRNLPDASRIFRPYTNIRTSIGISYKFL